MLWRRGSKQNGSGRRGSLRQVQRCGRCRGLLPCRRYIREVDRHHCCLNWLSMCFYHKCWVLMSAGCADVKY